MLVLRDADVLRAITMDMAVEAIERGFRDVGHDRARTVPRRRVQLGGCTLHVLGGATAEPPSFAAKAYMTAPGGGSFWTLLFDGDGDAVAVIEATELSRIRTGAATGVATRWLSRPESRTLAIIGSGKQAPRQVEAVCAVRAIDEVRAWSPTREHVERFAMTTSRRVGVAVEVAPTARAAVEGADVVVLMTTSRTPVFLAEWLEPGMHLNLVGCNRPTCREVEPDVVAVSDLVVVDDLEQARLEAGDLHEAIGTGRARWSDVRELSDVISERRPGRTGSDQVSVFDSLGVGIEDVVVSQVVHERARASGLGTVI